MTTFWMDAENAVIEKLMEVILRYDLSSGHGKALLGQTIRLLEWGKHVEHRDPNANAWSSLFLLFKIFL